MFTPPSSYDSHSESYTNETFHQESLEYLVLSQHNFVDCAFTKLGHLILKDCSPESFVRCTFPKLVTINVKDGELTDLPENVFSSCSFKEQLSDLTHTPQFVNCSYPYTEEFLFSRVHSDSDIFDHYQPKESSKESDDSSKESDKAFSEESSNKSDESSEESSKESDEAEESNEEPSNESNESNESEESSDESNESNESDESSDRELDKEDSNKTTLYTVAGVTAAIGLVAYFNR